MPNLENHYAQAELDRVAPLFLFSPQAQSFKDIGEYVSITDLGGFTAIRVDGACAQILKEDSVERINTDRMAVFQLDGNNSIVDFVIIAPDYTPDSDIDLKAAYEYAVANDLNGNDNCTRDYQEWLDCREYVARCAHAILSGE